MYEYGFSTDILARVVEVVMASGLITSQGRIFDPLGWSIPASWWTKPRGNRLAKVYEHGKNASFNRREF